MKRTRLLALTAAAVLWIAGSFVLPTSWVEQYYARGLYPWISTVLAPVSGAIGVSCSLIAIPLVVAVMLVWSVRAWRRQKLEGSKVRSRLLGVAGRWLLVALLLYGWFLLTWGLGYRREPIEQRLDLGDAAVSARDIGELTERMVAIVVRDVPAPDARDTERALDAVRAAMRDVVQRWDSWSPSLPHIKRPPAGLMLATGTVGAVSPWLLEAHVEGALPDTWAISVGGHELAHIAGYCGEADADLLGFAAGLEAEDAFARYATALSVLRDIARELTEEEWRAVDARLPAAARADMTELDEVVEAHVIPWLSSLRSSAYDSYLHSHGVEEGIRDYARGVALLVRAWRRERVVIR